MTLTVSSASSSHCRLNSDITATIGPSDSLAYTVWRKQPKGPTGVVIYFAAHRGSLSSIGACHRLWAGDGQTGSYVLTFSGGLRRRCPEVGFGAVATYQVTSSPRLSFTAWPSFCLQPRYLSVV
jgi:hypothetical protein